MQRGTGKGLQGLVVQDRGGSTDEGSPHATPDCSGRSCRVGAGRRSVAQGLLGSSDLSTQVLFTQSGGCGLKSRLQSGTEDGCRRYLKLYIVGVVASSAVALVVTTLLIPIGDRDRATAIARRLDLETPRARPRVLVRVTSGRVRAARPNAARDDGGRLYAPLIAATVPRRSDRGSLGRRSLEPPNSASCGAESRGMARSPITQRS